MTNNVLMGTLNPVLTRSCVHIQSVYQPVFLTIRVSRYQNVKPSWILLQKTWWRWQRHGNQNRKTCKAQSHHPHQHTNTQVFAGRMPFLSPNQPRQSTDNSLLLLLLVTKL